jgi:uncharacterized damage-inducible protein DinB
MTEVWLRGPIAGVEPLLMPVVHSLLQVREEVEAAVLDLDDEQLWQRPGGAASVGFHVRHIGGSTLRLLTYARAERLTAEQLAEGSREETDIVPREQLLSDVRSALDRALEQIRATSPSVLLEERKVGRAGLPSTVLGLLFHVAEHAARHSGQAITTALVVRANRANQSRAAGRGLDM